MKKSYSGLVLFLLFVVGISLILGSVSWGREAAHAYLRSQGGSMDSAQFAIVLQETINTYRWIGLILSVISGFGLLKANERRYME